MTIEYVAEVYDDRDDKVISRGKERRDYDTAWDEAKSLMNDFIDPDDGVRPSHFHPRVVEVKR